MSARQVHRGRGSQTDHVGDRVVPRRGFEAVRRAGVHRPASEHQRDGRVEAGSMTAVRGVE
jgi:hypothetical protein